MKLDQDAKMSQQLKLSKKASIEYKLSPDDIKDFRVPLDCFRIYCNAIKSFSPDLQDQILKAMGVFLSDKTLVEWDSFVQLNCFLIY